MKVLVVDDERAARLRLRRMLDTFGGHEVLEASSGPEALALLSQHAVDVVLLDISMPGMDGLTVARLAPDGPVIVFTTAHDQHAVSAFDVHAADFLVKPVRTERLKRALQRAAERTLRAGPAAADGIRIQARQGADLHLVDARRIARFYATDKYVGFRIDGREFLIDDSLSALEDRLSLHGFVRCHRAELVQITRAVRLVATDEGLELVTDDGQHARVSRRLAASLRARLTATDAD